MITLTYASLKEIATLSAACAKERDEPLSPLKRILFQVDGNEFRACATNRYVAAATAIALPYSARAEGTHEKFSVDPKAFVDALRMLPRVAAAKHTLEFTKDKSHLIIGSTQITVHRDAFPRVRKVAEPGSTHTGTRANPERVGISSSQLTIIAKFPPEAWCYDFSQRAIRAAGVSPQGHDWSLLLMPNNKFDMPAHADVQFNANVFTD